MDRGRRNCEEIGLPPRSDLIEAAAMRDRLLAAEGDVLLRGEAVEVLTTPMLQVMLAARTRFRETGRRLTLAAPSRECRDCLATLGAPAGDWAEAEPDEGARVMP